MATIVSVLVVVLAGLLAPATYRLLRNEAGPTRRVYRAIGVENALVGSGVAFLAFFAGFLMISSAGATAWSWAGMEPASEPSLLTDLCTSIFLFEFFGVLFPGIQLANLAAEGGRRLRPSIPTRLLQVLGVFAYLVVCGCPFALAMSYAVANHLLVTIVLSKMLNGFNPWHAEPESVVVGAAARERVAVDWNGAYILKGRNSAVLFAGAARWDGLPLHGQRALLVTVATQCVFIWAILGPMVAIRLLWLVS